MSEQKGYYALISDPVKVRFWNGFSWQGDAFDDPKIDIAGFVDSLDESPIQIVEEGEAFGSSKYCSGCGESVTLETNSCTSCGSSLFSSEMPQLDSLSHEVPIELQDVDAEPLNAAGFSRFTADPQLSSDRDTHSSAKSAPQNSFSEDLQFNMDKLARNIPVILVVTTHSVPGREIQDVLGVVVGQGNASFGTVKERHGEALRRATERLLRNAERMGADAIVATSYTVAGVRGFWGVSLTGQSVTVQISGTAVTLK